MLDARACYMTRSRPRLVAYLLVAVVVVDVDVVVVITLVHQAVAVVLAYLYRVGKGEMLEEPKVDLPEDMQFNETGQKLGEGQYDQ